MSINSFMASIRKGFRPHSFKVEILGLPDKMEFVCRSTSVPGKNTGKIELPYKGRKIPIAGDPVFDDWSTTIMLDTDLAIWNEIEAWSELHSNSESVLSGDVATYVRTANIIMMDGDKEIAEYKLIGVWPMTISPIELSHETTDEVSTFEVTWAYTTRIRVK